MFQCLLCGLDKLSQKEFKNVIFNNEKSFEFGVILVKIKLGKATTYNLEVIIMACVFAGATAPGIHGKRYRMNMM